MSRRLVPRVAVAITAVFGFSLVTAVIAEAHEPPTCGMARVADLAIQKQASETFADAGDKIVYTIEVTNLGPCHATAVVTDNLPNDVQFLSASGACTGTDPVTCTSSDLDIGESAEFTITVKVEETAGPDALVNVAEVAPQTGTDPDLANNETFAITGVGPPPESPPPEDGGGGGFGDFDDGFGGGGFNNFGTGFDTAATPLGGVDTGAGGTAGSDAAVPQIALASLLTIGLLLFGLRRFGRA